VTSHFYFAYGSNLDALQMQERCPTSAPVFRARLHGFRLDFTHYSTRWRGGAADVVSQAGDVVWGVVYRMHEGDLDLLDHFESGYERVALEVADDDGTLHRVVSYSVLAKDSHPPSDVYIEKMLRWGRHWGLPEEYLARLHRYR